jgi:phage terminase large subunit-like protein
MAADRLSAKLLRWRADPVAFIREVLMNPETKHPFDLYPAQERFLREALKPTQDGRLPYPELIFSAPKKSGKTTIAAMITLYTVLVVGGPYAEGYAVANDLEQAQGRVFQAIARIVEASPLLRQSATIMSNRITFPGSGATITAIASDYAGAAGANPTISTFDEL